MKHLIVLTIFVTGCATVAPLSYEEHCALRGMSFAGISDGLAMRSGERIEQINCRPASDLIEKCAVSQNRDTAIPKEEYNHSVLTRNWLTGAGYFVFVAPGIVGSVMSHNAKIDALKESEKAAKESAKYCSKRLPAKESQ